METIKLLSMADGPYLYDFTTTDKYNSLIIYCSEYHYGELVDKSHMGIEYDEIGSPEKGSIIIAPIPDDHTIKVLYTDESGNYSTDIAILENASEYAYSGSSAIDISENTDIEYDEEQPLIAVTYNNDSLIDCDINNLFDPDLNLIADFEYVYYFSFKFCKA